MDKIELKNLLFLARLGANEKDYSELIKKLENTKKKKWHLKALSWAMLKNVTFLMLWLKW